MTTRLARRRARRPGPAARDRAGRRARRRSSRATSRSTAAQLDAPRSRARRSTSAGNGFTPGALVDVSFDGKLDRTIQADAGRQPARPRRSQSPYQAQGPGHVHADRGRARQPGQHGRAAVAHDRARRSSCSPRDGRAVERASASAAAASPQQAAVWAHYLYKGKVRKTVRLVKRRIDNPCGTLLRPAQADPDQAARSSGSWTLQVDQQQQLQPRAGQRVASRDHRRPAVFTPRTLTGSRDGEASSSPSPCVHADVVAGRRSRPAAARAPAGRPGGAGSPA